MQTEKLCDMAINTFEDVLISRKKTREIMEKLKFPILEQTKFITAISEVVRNVVIHAKDGQYIVLDMSRSGKVGIKCIVSDKGPGIKDVNKALSEGYSTVGSLGLGLAGAQNLSDSFDIRSGSSGTTIEVTKWL